MWAFGRGFRPHLGIIAKDAKGPVWLCRESICSVPLGATWSAKAAGRCRDCVSPRNLCAEPPQLLLHQYLNRLDPVEPEGNLVSLKAYLLTQASTVSPDQSVASADERSPQLLLQQYLKRVVPVETKGSLLSMKHACSPKQDHSPCDAELISAACNLPVTCACCWSCTAGICGCRKEPDGVTAVQDLDKTHLILWTDNPGSITTDDTRVSAATVVPL